jgi:DNA polymerase III subunit epsilon
MDRSRIVSAPGANGLTRPARACTLVQAMDQKVAPLPGRRRKKTQCVDHIGGPFVAIDFETADTGRDSACAIAAVRVEGDRIVDRCVRLIRPPRQLFQFTYIHGIRWADVAREPTFGPVWKDVCSLLEGAAFLAAHNASFDRSVLNACCSRAGIDPPSLPFECTVRWARQAWDLRPTNLPAVCSYLGLPLRHHDAASDAEACARIMVAARKDHLGRVGQPR